jgi:hypothetical protein
MASYSRSDTPRRRKWAPARGERQRQALTTVTALPAAHKSLDGDRETCQHAPTRAGGGGAIGAGADRFEVVTLFGHGNHFYDPFGESLWVNPSNCKAPISTTCTAACISVSYYPNGTGPPTQQGPIRFTYQDAVRALTFRDDVRVVDVPDVGSIVSVTIVQTIDTSRPSTSAPPASAWSCRWWCCRPTRPVPFRSRPRASRPSTGSSWRRSAIRSARPTR